MSPGARQPIEWLRLRGNKISVIAMVALTLLIGFLAFELSEPHPADLTKLGVSGLVTLVVGALVNPDDDDRLLVAWWVLLLVTALGALTSGILTGFADHPAASPALTAFAAGFVGLLVDGARWSVGQSGGK